LSSLVVLAVAGAFVIALPVSGFSAMPVGRLTSVLADNRSGQVVAPQPSRAAPDSHSRPGQDSTARLIVSLIIAALFAIVVLGALWLLWGMAQRP
jgi:hypothetical protein